ncbi:MAG: M23 family metallopeptidase [Spirochaetia bacterium]|nr:M23 family metallopeptidase [Spirochaetia bacterium]
MKKKKKSKVYTINPTNYSSKGIVGQISYKLWISFENFKRFIRAKKAERLTLMLVPHNDAKAKNFHISNFTFSIIIIVFTSIVVISSVLIINHTSTIHQVDKLKISQKDAKIQFKKIREEIQGMEGSFSSIRSRLSHLYALSQGKENSDLSLFGQGGVSVPIESVKNNEITETEVSDEHIPTEVYMLNRMLDDMQLSEKPLKEIEKYLQKRSKIIQNTPTLWPVSGYIVNPYGYIRNSETMKTFFNEGVDIVASPGAKIVVTAPGIITEIKKDTNRTLTVRVRHNYGYETLYKGLDRILVNLDDKVVKGETLGFLAKKLSQDEGILHYRIYVGIDTQNPLPYLSYIPN